MIVFIAVPTKGVTADGKLNDSFHRDIAHLHLEFPDITFLVPMIQDYAILPHMNVDATWEQWGIHCKRLISVSDAVWVMMYNGADQSVGVQAEIAFADQQNVPVKFIYPN